MPVGKEKEVFCIRLGSACDLKDQALSADERAYFMSKSVHKHNRAKVKLFFLLLFKKSPNVYFSASFRSKRR